MTDIKNATWGGESSYREGGGGGALIFITENVETSQFAIFALNNIFNVRPSGPTFRKLILRKMWFS